MISSHGSRDLSNPDDRYILRIEVAHAAWSSDDTSRRIKRRNGVFRERGRTTGGRRRSRCAPRAFRRLRLDLRADDLEEQATALGRM